MTTIIETDRLILRELTEADADGMFELDGNPEVHRYLSTKPLSHIDQARDVISLVRQQYIDNGIGRWAAIEKASGNFIGWAGLKLVRTTVNGHTDYYDIGYRLIPRYWNKGYATEATLATIGYAFNTLQLKELHASAHLDNHASNRILQKVGMQFIGQFLYEEKLMCNWYKLTR